jgi:hypothetical protein
MKVPKKLIPLFLLAVTTSLSSCASNPNTDNKTSEVPLTNTPSVAASPTPDAITPTETPTVTASPTPNGEAPTVTPTTSPSVSPSAAKLREKTKLDESEKTKLSYSTIPSANQTPSGKTVDVTVYTIDSQCQEFVPQKTSVPANEPVIGAVGRALEGNDNGDFSLSGYRVSVKNGVATVDLRVSPNSKRLLSSLSSCENSALFGSVRKTLTSNPQWKIRDVRFTEKGEEVVF